MVNFAQKITKRVRAQPSSKNGQKTTKKPTPQQSLGYARVIMDLVADHHKKCTVFDWVDIPSGSNAVFYGDGVKFSGELPNYEPHDTSQNGHLTFVDCHRALVASIYKARLILFELKRQGFGLKSGQLVLDGTPRRLDEELVQDVKALEERLEIHLCVGPLLERLLTAHLRLHPRFEVESATLQASLLRVDKTFRTRIIEPLKNALVDKKNNPDYEKLQATNRQIQASALAACCQWCNSMVTTRDELRITPAWKQAENLAARIKELEERAEQHGWRMWKDKAFEALVGGERRIFDTAEGPDEAITYLENWCQKAETQQVPSNGAS